MPNMKFYMTPGSCSTGIHILLEELGLVFEAHIVNLPAGDQYQPDYLAINPKSTIPVLITPEGRAITEFPAIAYWLARRYPRAGLLPGDIAGDTLAMETMHYVVGTVHMQGFTRIFTTENYAFHESDIARINARGETIVKKSLNIIDNQLAGKRYIAGEFSIADAALFYVEFWAARTDISLPVNCQSHYQLMLRRPAVKQVLMEEGYSAVYRDNRTAHAT